MNFKKLAMALSITAAFCYMGCEDSTSASSAGGDDDQPTLSSDSKGGDDGQNTKSSDSKDNTGGDEKTTSSASTVKATVAERQVRAIPLPRVLLA